MRAMLIPAVLSLGLAAAWSVQPAAAAGCLKGAVVGGVAGHLAHHGVLGAMAGCAVGHHEASKHARKARQAENQANATERRSH